MNNVIYLTSLSIAKRMTMYIIIALLFFVASSKAQNYDTIYVESAQKKYIKILDTERASVKESAIFNVMALAQYYPDHNYAAVIAKLHELSTVSENPKICYKAFLALNFFKHSAWFDDYSFVRQQDTDRIFLAIAETVNNRLLKISQN